MKKWKKVAALVVAMTLVLANFTNIFAYGWGNRYEDKDKNTSTTYSHMSIAVYTENTTENGGYYLASKPGVTVDGDKITLGSKQSSQNNGYEYQSGMSYKFTTDTVFVVTAVLTDGKEKIEVTFEISDVDNYKNSGKSFYEYCAANWCDSDNGIDMKLTYEDIVEHFYDVKYDVDGDFTQIIDDGEYEEGDVVTLKDDVPVKEGYEFIGWEFNGEIVEDGKITMPEGGATLVAKFAKLYTVTYKVDGNVVDTKEVKEGTDVSDWASKAYDVEDGKTFSGWVLETTAADVNAIDMDVVVTATTTVKTFTITYYLNGKQYGDVETVAYGADVELKDYEVPEGYNFTGWTVEKNADITNVTEDIVINGETSVKQFTVVYKVNGEVVDTFENVDYGMEVPASDFEVSEGYDFSGWTVDGSEVPDAVLADLVIEATTSVKTFTVTFVDENGNVIATETYTYGAQADEATAPKKADEKSTDETGAAQWVKYTFNGWKAQGEYTLDNLDSVKEDMTFEATYSSRNVVVKYFVLNQGLEQPEELTSYPTTNYSEGLVGTIASFEQIANDDDAVLANLVSVPTGFQDIDSDAEIKWYVIKKVNEYEWHVDGIVVNQMYNLTINYVDADTQDAVAESVMTQVAATDSYEYTSPVLDSHKLSDEAQAVVEGTMPYADVEITVEYNRNTYTVTYVVDGETVATFEDVVYGSMVPEYTYDVAEGFTFTGFGEKPEMVTGDLVFEGTTSEIPTEEVTTEEETTTEEESSTEEEESVEIDIPFADPSTEPSSEEVTTEVKEEIITTEVPLAPVQPSTEETTTEEETTSEEEEELDVNIPFADGQPQTGDSSNTAMYVTLLLVAAIGGAAAVFAKKSKTNE